MAMRHIDFVLIFKANSGQLFLQGASNKTVSAGKAMHDVLVRTPNTATGTVPVSMAPQAVPNFLSFLTGL
jgi:hypothetical protein